MPQIDRIWYTIDAETKGFDEGVLKAGDKLKNFTEYAKGAPLVVIGALAAAAVVAGAKIAEMGQKFEYAMARVNTAAQVPKAALVELGNGVLQIAKDTGAGLDDLTRGLYDIVSSGIPASKALEVLEVAAKGAVGGVTNVAVVVDGLTSILNAYRDENLDVAKVQDQMFEAVNKGKITYEELAGSIGQVVGIAATMGIQLDDLLGVITQLSLQGVHTSEAITGVRSAIENIIKPAQQFSQLFPELAAQFNEGRLRGEGFTKFLLDLHVAAKGNNQVFASLFGSVEAYKTVLAALQHEGRDTAAMQRDIANATGSADAAFKELNETTEQTEKRLKAGINAQLTELGERLLPAKQAVLGLVLELVKLTAVATPSDFVRPIEQLADKLKSGAFADGSVDLRRLRSEAEILNSEFLKGTLNLNRYSQEELKKLNDALNTVEGTYKDLGQTLGSVHGALKNVIAEQALAGSAAATAAAAQKRQDALAATGLAVSQGNQSARDILTPPTQSQTYTTALRQRDAITKAITASEHELAKAAEDAQAALTAGDDAALADAKKRAEAARASIEAQRATAKQALSEIYQYELRLSQQVNAVVSTVAEATAKATHSTADDLLAQIEKIDNDVAHVRERGGIIDQASVDRVKALYDGMVLVAVAADRTKQVLEQTAHADGTRGTPEDFDAIATREAQLKQLLNGLDKTAEDYADRRRDIEAQITELEKRRTELVDRNLEGYKKVVDELARIRNHTSQLIRDQAQAIDSLIKAGVALGAAFHLVDSSIASMLSNLSTIGTSIKPFLDELDKFNSGQKDSKGNPLATFSSIVAVGLPILSAATSIIGTLFGGNAAAEQQRKQIVQQNTDAIQKLTQQMVQFGSVDVTGQTFSKAQQAVKEALAPFADNKFTSKEFENLPKALAGDLARLGLSMSDLEKIAQGLGLTLDKSNLLQSLQQLQEAMKDFDLAQFNANYTDQLTALQASFDILDITDPVKKLQAFLKLLSNADYGSPAIAKALEGLDLSTPQGRAQAEQAIQDLFNKLETHGLTADDLHGLTPQQFLQALEELKKELDDANGGGPGGTGGYNVSREITETSAGALIAQLTTSNVWLKQIADSTAVAAAALSGSVTSLGPLPPLTPPIVPSGGGGSGLAGLILDLSGMVVQITIQPGASIADAQNAGQQAGAQIGQQVLDSINKGLNADLLRKKRLNGSTSIRGLS